MPLMSQEVPKAWKYMQCQIQQETTAAKICTHLPQHGARTASTDRDPRRRRGAGMAGLVGGQAAKAKLERTRSEKNTSRISKVYLRSYTRNLHHTVRLGSRYVSWLGTNTAVTASNATRALPCAHSLVLAQAPPMGQVATPHAAAQDRAGHAAPAPP